MSKFAVFIHGWSDDNSKWKEKKNKKLFNLFKDRGYKIIMPAQEEPGKYGYLEEKYLEQKGFDFYATCVAKLVDGTTICECCGRKNLSLPDEIIIIAHSMGGVASRLYLSDDRFGDPEIKARVKKIITLASPHHGTEVIPVSAISGFSTALFASPTLKSLYYLAVATVLPLTGIPITPITVEGLPGAVAGIAELVLEVFDKCYRQLKINSNFLYELQQKKLPSTVKAFSIWTKGDAVVKPIHTAVWDEATNIFIDDGSVNHQSIVRSNRTINIVESILEDNVSPVGIQKYPVCSCGSKKMVPIFIPPLKLKSFIKSYKYKCLNRFHDPKTNKDIECNIIKYSLWKPSPLGCEVGIMKKRSHFWVLTGMYRWKCKKCGEIHSSKRIPSSYQRKGCKGFASDYHWWELLDSEWECINDNCNKKEWSFFMPKVVGCSSGIIKKGFRFHSWKKIKTVYNMFFLCTECLKPYKKSFEV